MRYKNGVLRSLIGSSWVIETRTDKLSYKSGGQAGTINYYDINDVSIKTGMVSDSVVVKSQNGRLNITDFSAVDATRLNSDIIKCTKKAVANEVSKHFEALNEVSARVEEFLGENRYIAQSDIRAWLKAFPEIGKHLSHPYFEISFLPKDIRERMSLLDEIQTKNSETLKQRNIEFVQKAMRRHQKLFNKLEKYPLTEEQKRAAIIDEDRNLLIAAAGSGKSSTIVAKVVYLIESGLAQPNEILVLAYNKDAQVEIQNRLAKAQSKLKQAKNSVKAKTFHSYGLEVISAATGNKPSIAKIAAAKKTVLNRMFTELIYDLGAKNPTFYASWVQYLTTARGPLPEVENIKTKSDYDNFLKQMGAQWRGPSGNRSLRLITINNKEVKSLEELRIFNWLVINGVEFEYEQPYEVQTNDANYSQYHPDFFYPEVNLYHEHFALDPLGNAPTFMQDYLEGVQWKRQLHEEHQTELIETWSADFLNGDIFESLKSKLQDFGVKFKPMQKNELDALIEASFEPSRDVDVFVTFLRHFKSNDFEIEEIDGILKIASDRYRSSLFIELFKAIYKEYQRQLHHAEEIDFEDQINIASKYLENNVVTHSWKYVLVDEFQDISQDRKRLILSILGQDEYMKLFAVGDDWQSIYRFSGADIDIMTSFEQHFGSTAQNNLTQTFRSYQGLVDVAAQFIQKNERQLQKNVVAQNNIDANQVVIKEYSNEVDQTNIVFKLLQGIQKKAFDEQAEVSVFILARYNHHLPKNRADILTKFQSLQIDFKTVHAAKGLEADYVILLNMSGETYGFPSLIEDDPLIKLIIPKSEDFPHAEERRLFYVALTRAKRVIFLMSKKASVSKFVTEIANQSGVSAPLEMQQQSAALNNTSDSTKLHNQSLKCSKCNKGTLRIKTDKAGLNEPFLGCSSYPNCKHIQRPATCPKCKLGKIVRRVNRKTQEPFYPCSRFDCDYKHKNKFVKRKLRAI